MTASERWARLQQLFGEALERPAAERQAWLAGVHGNEELYSEVRALLDAHDSDPGFLEQGIDVAPEDLAAAIEPPSSHTFSPNTVVGNGRYRIIGEAGRGGMAVVYVAEDLRLPRRVAMKALPPAALADPARRERFRREAWAAARISHPAIATIYEFDEFDGQPFIVYEYVRGRTLRAALSDGPLEPALVRRVAIEVARAMVAAHDHGVIHRDLKPENVMICEDGTVKVLDFGIAQLDTGDAALTIEGMFVGTPAYMAPEQRVGGAVDGRADVYSFGIMLSEMLSGRHPLAARTPAPGARSSSGSGASTAARAPVPAVALAGTLDRIAQRCLQADPAARFPSARDLLRALEGTGPAGSTPGEARRWWEFHQVAMTVVYALAVVAVWEAWNQVHGVFADPTVGRRVAVGFVVLVLGAAILAGTLRLNLWFTSRFLPEQLQALRQRRRAWIRGVDTLLQVAVASEAILILDRSPQRSVILLALAFGAAFACLFIEPITERAAFEEAGAANQP